ncbi:hypothetical protein B0H11DRAFT_2280597, partial [Mycena galericulata]
CSSKSLRLLLLSSQLPLLKQTVLPFLTARSARWATECVDLCRLARPSVAPTRRFAHCNLGDRLVLTRNNTISSSV